MLLKAEHVSYAYGEKTVLEDVSFTVSEGELLLVCGETGCGKSTLLRMLKPELLTSEGTMSGQLFLAGEPLREKQSEIGFVMQRPEQQAVTDYVWHELAFGLENQGIPSPEIRRRVAEIAAYFDMEEWYQQLTDTLSGGQLQQLILASVMVTGSGILVLDEPTSRLDPIAASQFFEMLSRLRRELGLTMIVAEHRLEELFAEADQVLYLKEGQVGAYGTPQAVARQLMAKHDPFVCALPAALQVAFQEQAEKGNGCEDGMGGDSLPLSIREGRRYVREQGISKERAETVIPRFTGSGSAKNALVLEISDLQAAYGGQEVLSGVDLTVASGECVAVVGGNAAGKSTLLRCISGVASELTWEGTLSLFGKRVRFGDRSREKSSEKLDTRLSYLPQDVTVLFSEERVEDEWKRYATFLGKPEAPLPTYFQEVSLRNRHPYDLSGGQQQLLGLEKVMLRSPKLLLLDEPTQGMDAMTRRELAERLARYKKEGGAILMATHDLVFVQMLADRTAMLFRGEIVAEGDTETFLNQNLFYTTPVKRLYAKTSGKEKRG